MEEDSDKKITRSKQGEIDIKRKVMRQIEEKRIKMRSPLFFVVKKTGLGSVLALAILGGALVIAVIFYILKKTGAFEFLKLGLPGVKIFLVSFPYDYLALFLVTLMLGSYIVRKLNSSLWVRHSFNIPAMVLLAVTVFLGAFFAFMGGEQLIRGFYADRSLSKDVTIVGKIVGANNKEVVIQEEGGNLKAIIFDNGKVFPYTNDYATGKTLRVIGRRDLEDPPHFHAENIICCD